jgi:hypothetical protein
MNHPNPASSQPWRALPPAAVKRSRSLDHRFQPCSREASAMTMIGTRAYAGCGAPQGDTPGSSPGHRLGGGS